MKVLIVGSGAAAHRTAELLDRKSMECIQKP